VAGVDLDDQVLPVGAHHTVEDHWLLRRVEPCGGPGVAHDQVEGVDHWAVDRVIGAELQHPEELDQAPSVVVRVGRLEHQPFAAVVLGAAGPVLGHQVLQHGLPAGGGVDDLPDGAVGRRQRGLGDLTEHGVLARDPAEIPDELLDDLLVGVGVDAVQGGDEQPDQRVGDLPLTFEQQG
jgi:hypothetical protein